MICYNCFREKGDSSVCPHCRYDAAASKGRFPTALPAGIDIGKDFILGRVLGQGGFGITYIAWDRKNNLRVAIKEYFPDSMAARDGTRKVTPYTGERGEGFLYGKKCFLEEAKTLATFIGNKNIVRVFRYFEENGTAYFVMEYVEGTSLKDYLKKHGGKISFEEAKRILIPMMDALTVVHSKGIVHRDISPDNIIITKSGRIKLLDFGAARYSLGDMSRSLDVVLKHGYAPREQYSRHGRQGPFTDVYSLAATFYRSITGVVPQDSIDRMDDDQLITPYYYCSDLTPQGEFALYKGLAVQPADRFQSTQQLKECLLTTAPVPPAHFRPGPAQGGQPAPQPNTGTSGSPSGQQYGSYNPPAHQSYNPPAPQSYNPAQQSYHPAQHSYNPPASQSYMPPVTAQPTPKKKIGPLKSMLISFGISMAVFAVILAVIWFLK